MTAQPIRHNAQVPDRNGKIFYASFTSLSHISKVSGYEAADGRWRRGPHRYHSGTSALRALRLIRSQTACRGSKSGQAAQAARLHTYWLFQKGYVTNKAPEIWEYYPLLVVLPLIYRVL